MALDHTPDTTNHGTAIDADIDPHGTTPGRFEGSRMAVPLVMSGIELVLCVLSNLGMSLHGFSMALEVITRCPQKETNCSDCNPSSSDLHPSFGVKSVRPLSVSCDRSPCFFLEDYKLRVHRKKENTVSVTRVA